MRVERVDQRVVNCGRVTAVEWDDDVQPRSCSFADDAGVSYIHKHARMRPLNDHGASEWTDVYQVSSGILQYHPHRFQTVPDKRTRMDWLVTVWFIFGVFLLDFFSRVRSFTALFALPVVSVFFVFYC